MLTLINLEIHWRESLNNMTKDVKRSSTDIHGNPEDLRVGETLTDREHDAVFGDMSKDGPNYRDVNIILSLLSILAY